MKYCPKCKRLYNDGDEVCTCPACKGKALNAVEDETEPVYLCSGDVMERDRVQAALEDNGVPSVFKRHTVTASSQVVTGYDFDGFDVLVPYELYEKAYDIAVGIGAIKLEGEQVLDDEAAEDAEPDKMSRAKRTTVRVITAILFILLVAVAIYGTDFITGLIKNLFK